MLKPPLGSLELQNEGPFPLMPKDPDFSGEGLSSLHGALSPYLLGIDLASLLLSAVQGQAWGAVWRGEPGPASLPREAAVLLMKGLYRPLSADTGCIIHTPGTGAHPSGARNMRRLGFLILGRHGVHIRKY